MESPPIPDTHTLRAPIDASFSSSFIGLDDPDVAASATGVDGRDVFKITGSSLTLQAALDFERRQRYSLLIVATDRLSADALNVTAAVNVTVTDVNDIVVTGVAPSVLPASSSSPVVLTGSNFGSAAQVFKAYYGPVGDPRRYTATNCSVTVPNTEVTCASAPGVGLGHKWTLCVDTACSLASTGTTGYAAPAVVAVTTATPSDTLLGWGSTRGNDTVVLTLTNVGISSDTFAATSLAVTYGLPDVAAAQFTAAGCTIGPKFPSGADRVTCRTVPGAGSGLQWRVSVGGQTSVWSGPTLVTTYARPVVTNVTSPALGTPGGALFGVNGTNLGECVCA